MNPKTLKIVGWLALGGLGLVVVTQPTSRGQEPAPKSEQPLRLVAHEDVDSKSFTTSGSCALCHGQSEQAKAMRDGEGRGIAPYDLWQSTMMANSARDPLWRAVVSMEVAATPSKKAAIEAKCLRCHSPMASTEASRGKSQGKSPLGLDVLYGTGPRAQLALDGVSCTVCHQIQPKNLGKPESFSGHYEIGTERVIFGPHAEPVPGPMRAHTGFTPQEGKHVRESALCATCHTLFTDAFDAEGKLTGHRLPEQTPYLEWRNSIFNDEIGERGASCQSCHVPTRDQDGKTIKTKIAHAPPGFDFPFIEPRSPFGRHLFVGGNTLIPAILRDNREDLRPRASKKAFDATIAMARSQLTKRTARIALRNVQRKGDTLQAEVAVTIMTGHKFPTGHPTRRAWLQLVVTDVAGRVLFSSGSYDTTGRILGAKGKPLAEEVAGGPTYPHREVVKSSDEVLVYESVMGDSKSKPTFLLTRGASYLKDNRLLPLGWRADHADAEPTQPRGVGKDANFLGGRDRVRYEITLPQGTQGPLRVEARLLYQVLGARYADEIFQFDTREIRAFNGYWQKADRRPVVVAQTHETL
ncbi:MAG: hypothetical protein JKY65_19300 [Planctomycetes bacterium]|nr:hypothetical protein [Planctomycetota bacterium]